MSTPKTPSSHNTFIGIAPDSSQAVDLGLPSGTLWAPWNVGAANEAEAGAFFAWGETTPAKQCYDWKTYAHGAKPAKYNSEDNATRLSPADDAATANWGPQWRMPTTTQLEELRNECEWTWVNEPVAGFVVRSIRNLNSIFLPAAGNRVKDEARFTGSDGNYWSADVRPAAPEDAFFFYFHSGGGYISTLNRCGGRSVRAVLAD